MDLELYNNTTYFTITIKKQYSKKKILWCVVGLRADIHLLIR